MMSNNPPKVAHIICEPLFPKQAPARHDQADKQLFP